MVKANIIKVKVYPKDLKSIPDILPFNQLLHGEPRVLELNKKEILRCMNFGDVFDITSGNEVLIDEIAFSKIVEYVEVEDDSSNTGKEVQSNDPAPKPTPSQPDSESEKTTDESNN